MSNVPPTLLRRFADERDYRLMDPTIAPVVDFYLDMEHTLDPKLCEKFGFKVTPPTVIEIDLCEDER